MKRTQIQLDESAFERLREIAHRQGVSIAHLIREAVDEAYGTGVHQTSRNDLTFVGRGRSESPSRPPVSEEHDEALDEVWSE